MTDSNNVYTNNWGEGVQLSESDSFLMAGWEG